MTKINEAQKAWDPATVIGDYKEAIMHIDRAAESVNDIWHREAPKSQRKEDAYNLYHQLRKLGKSLEFSLKAAERHSTMPPPRRINEQFWASDMSLPVSWPEDTQNFHDLEVQNRVAEDLSRAVDTVDGRYKILDVDYMGVEILIIPHVENRHLVYQISFDGKYQDPSRKHTFDSALEWVIHAVTKTAMHLVQQKNGY